MGGTSQRQVEANRRNARKSTGPRTAEGKRRSRANGLRHGLRAEALVPEEERAAYEVALACWEREAGPDNVVEAQLIRRAAVASVRLERIERANEEAREQAARRAVGGWERRMQARARKAGQRLMLDPVGVVEELESSAFGCEWLIRRWRALEAALRQGRAWGRAEVQSAQALLGLPVMVPGPCGDPSSRRLWGLAARSNPSGVEEPPPSPTADQDGWPRRPGEAWQALIGFVAEQVDRLMGLRDEAWEAVEGPECAAIARLAAAADTSPEGQLRHRYEVSADRSCNAAIRLFLNVRDRRRRELLAIAKEAAEIGDTPRAPVGGGWWREADSAPTPPGFARFDLAQTELNPKEVSLTAVRPSPTDPVAEAGRVEVGSAAAPAVGESELDSGPEPESPVRERARPRVRGTAPPPGSSPTAAIRLDAPDRPSAPGAAPASETTTGRPSDRRAGLSSPDATRPSEPISAGAPAEGFDRKSCAANDLGSDRLGRPRGDDRRTDPSPTPTGTARPPVASAARGIDPVDRLLPGLPDRCDRLASFSVGLRPPPHAPRVGSVSGIGAGPASL